MPASKRVLLVNDDKKDSDKIKEMFKNTGVKISTAGSEFGMFNTIEEYGKTADMVVIDLELKKSDGLELVDKLRHNDKYKDLPVVVLGETVGTDTILKIKEMNVNSLVKKPINRDLLVDRVRSILKLKPNNK